MLNGKTKRYFIMRVYDKVGHEVIEIDRCSSCIFLLRKWEGRDFIRYCFITGNESWGYEDCKKGDFIGGCPLIEAETRGGALEKIQELFSC